MAKYKAWPLYDPKNGKQLTKKYLEGLAFKERAAIGDFLIDVFYGKMPLLKNYISDATIMDFYNSLKNRDHKAILDGDDILNTSDSTTILSKIFFPYSFFGSCDEKTQSIKEVFNDKKLLKKVIYNRFVDFIHEGKPYCFNGSIQMIIQGMRSTRVAANISIFKNVIGKMLYDLYVPKNGRVFDYSAGFGNRCLASQSLNKNITYVGTDPNKKTCEEFNNMITYFNFGANCQIHNQPSEEFLVEDKFDFIFSSPPYFKKEIYSSDKTQCYNKYPDYQDWLEKYWDKTVQNSKKMLKEHGHFGLNIMKDYEKDMCRIIEKNGFTLQRRLRICTQRSHLTSKSITYRKKHNIPEAKKELYKYNESIVVYKRT